MLFRRPINRTLAVLLPAALIALNPADGQTFHYLREGMQAPDFSLKSFDGKQVRLQDALGTSPVVLVFWASWSSRGFAELEELGQLRERFPGAAFRILAVNVDAQTLSSARRDSIRSLVRAYEAFAEFLWDDGLSEFHHYGVIAVPSTLVLDSTGRIRAAINGYTRTGRVVLEDSLNRLLGRTVAAVSPRFEGYVPQEKSRLHLNLGFRLLHERQLDKAEKELRRACELDSLFVQPLLSLGETLVRSAKLDQAEAAYRKAFLLDPQSALALGKLGELSAKRGDRAAALDLFQRALTVDPNYYPARVARAELYIQSGEFAAARSDLDAAQEASPSDPRLIAACAQLAQASGDLPAAIRMLRVRIEEFLSDR